MLRPKPYAFLPEGSARRFIDRIAAEIAGDARALALLERPGARVTSDLKARVKSRGTPLVKGLYWSVQCPDPSAWGGLRARTLIAGLDRLDWLDLPTDPKLPALPRLRTSAGVWKILRYIPLRRMTLWHQPAVGPARIIKVKRTDRAADAAHRLALASAATQDGFGFTVPRLLETVPDGAFALSLCPGTALGTGLPGDAGVTLRAIGRMHASLHRCSAPGLPPEDRPANPLPLITALCPDLSLSDLAHQLQDRPARSAPVLCHGDFALDQILLGPDGLALVDFDRCHAGDAAADIARFLVNLAEAPCPGPTAAQARTAYLAGYAEVREPPDPARLNWHLAEAVANRILVCLRKDQPHLIPGFLALIQSPVQA